MTATHIEPRAIPAGTIPRLLPPTSLPTLEAHERHFGPLRPVDRRLIAEVEGSGLQGRGGAGFPTAVKLAAVARGRRPLVVVNATEGEPASNKDKTLLRVVPHLVIDGAAAAAMAVGADEVIVCVERSAGAQAARAAIEAAADERRPRLPIGIRVEALPDRYVAGEESALVHWLDGGEAKPTFVPPRPFEKGVGGRPTLVDNAETLAHLALIARYGGAWFRSVGTTTDPGSALMTISGAVADPGVYEIPLGVGLAEVIGHAGPTPDGVQAVLLGGYFGTWIHGSDVGRVELSRGSLAEVGAGFGCGVLAVLPGGVCPLAEAARVVRWLADQNAGQCGPCVLGLPAIADTLDAVVGGDRTGRALAALHHYAGLVRGRGACKHPDGAVRLVESTVTVFADHIAAHGRHGPCRRTPAVLPTPAPGGWR
ncbi:MAG TPA: NADH-ubiquinone oxidoreductase-F iron-sulfur binding region domain-containing protein [Acidimicrobiales bacterium]